MQRESASTLAKNSIANVARGSAIALTAIVLPPFLTRMMAPSAYGAWLLVIQLSAVVGYLDFGIQTAIGRFVAHAAERRDAAHRDRILSTSLAALTGAGLIGIMCTAGLAAVLPYAFHQVPPALASQIRLALVLVGSSLAMGLPCSVFNGIFIGLQRYEIPAGIIAGTRIVSAVALVLVVRAGGSLQAMGLSTALINLASYAMQYIAYLHFAPRAQFSIALISRATGRELFSYCFSLSVWSFAMLLVSGLDVSLVGYFEFRKVAYYAVASTLITFLAGLQNAIFHVMIPATAVLQARAEFGQLGTRMISATRYGMFILLLTGLPLIFAARGILYIWVGPGYAAEGARILQILTVANMIRLSALPYAVTLIGTGQQRLVILTPLLEGISNLLASVIAGYFLGAIGVAIGTVVGGTVGLLGNFLHNMPRTREVEFRLADYLRDGLLRPGVCALPLIVALWPWRSSFDSRNYILLAIAAAITAFLLWNWGLIRSERERVRLWRCSLPL